MPKEEDKAVKSGFDHDVNVIIESTMQGNVERKIETLTNIVYNMGKEMFGSKGNQRSEQKKQTTNRREQRMS